MIDLDPRLKDELERAVPVPDDSGRDWDDVLARTRTRAPRRRAVAVAAAAAAALVTGAALGASSDGFQAWLRGEPGTPASESEQAEFERATERSWAAFPDTPRLRRLISTEVGGTAYELFGFKTGNSLCLRLVARGLGDGPATSCAPLRELERASEPALVVLADHGLGEGAVPEGELPGTYAPPRASATFGVAADGVRAVEVVTDDGRREAVVAGNAFLYVADRPAVGTRVRRVVAIEAAGRRTPLPFTTAAFGFSAGGAPPAGEPRGPSAVERLVTGASIGWLERREPRGRSLEEAGLARVAVPSAQGTFARVLRPDRNGLLQIVVTLADAAALLQPSPYRGGTVLCIGLFRHERGVTGCNTRDRYFRRGPLHVVQSTFGGGNQFATFHGLASDDVAAIDVFLATGERVAVPLRDNVFAVEVSRAKFPARVVGYDAAGSVVAVETFLAESGPEPVRGEQRVALVVEGENGAKAVLRVGATSDGGRCWRISYSDGRDGGGCPQKGYRGDPSLDAAVVDVDGDVFLEIGVRPNVAAVEIRLADGTTRQLRPVEGFVVYPVPAAARRAGEVVRVFALDGDGDVVARRGLRLPR